MDTILISPASATVWAIPAIVFSIIIPLIGIAFFSYTMSCRLKPLFRASPDPRFDRIKDRIMNMVKYAIIQYRQPRYMLAGVLHISIFAGFVILSLRSITLVILGFSEGFVLPGLGGAAGHVYGVLKDFAGTFVLAAVLISVIRRGIFTPERYLVPPRYGKGHTWEAVFVLLLIAGLMTCDMFFEGSQAAARIQKGLETELLVPGTGTWIAAKILSGTPISRLQNVNMVVHHLRRLRRRVPAPDRVY